MKPTCVPAPDLLCSDPVHDHVHPTHHFPSKSEKCLFRLEFDGCYKVVNIITESAELLRLYAGTGNK
jgi:hypothetical protein